MPALPNRHAACMSELYRREEPGAITRTCPHCECDFEALVMGHATCPICGLDPSLPRLAFDDAPAYFLAGDPRTPYTCARGRRAASSSARTRSFAG